MNRYLEYDKLTGKIVCELFAEAPPPESGGTATLEIPAALVLDINNSLVRDGQIVRAYETTEERRERERLRREHAERSRKRIKELLWEFLVAMLESDETRVAELRAEYAALKKFL